MNRLLIAVALSFSLVTGCAVNPVTGKNELSLVSEAQEMEIGRKNYAPLRQSQGGDYTVDKKLTAYVSEIGQSLAAVSDRNLPYEFKVLNVVTQLLLYKINVNAISIVAISQLPGVVLPQPEPFVVLSVAPLTES